MIRNFLSKLFSNDSSEKTNEKLTEISKEILVKQNSFKENKKPEDEIKKMDEQIKQQMINVTGMLVDLNENLIDINKNKNDTKLDDAIQINAQTINKSIILTESL